MERRELKSNLALYKRLTAVINGWSDEELNPEKHLYLNTCLISCTGSIIPDTFGYKKDIN